MFIFYLTDKTVIIVLMYFQLRNKSSNTFSLNCIRGESKILFLKEDK